MKSFLAFALAVVLVGAMGGCAHAPRDSQVPTLRYVGSSTIANFIREAEPVYGKVRFFLNTESESAGGELAVLEGRADLAGVAVQPQSETLEKGVVATMIGRDAIAVVVHRSNPVRNLSVGQLKSIFTGRTRNWKEFGGPDAAIQPFIVGPASATRKVFRAAILKQEDYAGCDTIRPDADILKKVGKEPGGIGQISVSFLEPSGQVKVLAVEGHQPDPADAGYAITRPLYLLWWPARTRVADFIAWTSSDEARPALLRSFARGGGGEGSVTGGEQE